jgi:antitoxin StbD
MLKMSLIMVFLRDQTMLSQTLAKPLLATSAIGVTQLKRNPSAAIREAGDTPVAILQHNTPAAYLISAARYEAMLDVLDDVALRPLILDRQRELSQAQVQEIDELEAQAKAELAISKKKSRLRLA